MKKTFSRILSMIVSAAAVFTMSATVFAEGEPTMVCDSDKVISVCHKFGNAADTNLDLSLSDTGAITGRCLKLSEDFTGSVSNNYGGIYFESSDFGLDNFSGYTMTVNLKYTAKCAKATPNILIFTDGEQWVSEDCSTTTTDKWVQASVTCPASMNNTKMGISIPITDAFTGDVLFIDDVVITDNYGNQIANIGDIDTSIAQAPGTLKRVITTIVFVLIAAFVIVAGVFVFLKLKRRYR